MQIIDSFQSRLHRALMLRNMKQVELADRTGLDKTLINKYITGASNVRQQNLTILANALDVNEIWLMGYDVPFNRNLCVSSPDEMDLDNSITSKYGVGTVDLLRSFVKLNDIGKRKLNENASDLTKISDYIL